MHYTNYAKVDCQCRYWKLAVTWGAHGTGTATQGRDVTSSPLITLSLLMRSCNRSGNGVSGLPRNQKSSGTSITSRTDTSCDPILSSIRKFCQLRMTSTLRYGPSRYQMESISHLVS